MKNNISSDSSKNNPDKTQEPKPENFTIRPGEDFTKEDLEVNRPGPEEERIVAAQLDSQILRVIKVITRCSSGYPQLLLLRPFSPELTSPTIFWLSCPVLKEDISRLEDQGLLEELTDCYQSNEDFARRLNRAHQDYARLRRKLLSPADRERAEDISQDLLETLLNSGVGGIRDKGGLKCLHTHFAHYYAGYANPVGAEVAEKLNYPHLCRFCSRY